MSPHHAMFNRIQSHKFKEQECIQGATAATEEVKAAYSTIQAVHVSSIKGLTVELNKALLDELTPK